MSGRDTPDWLTTVQRQAFALPGSPITVTSGNTQTLDVSLDTTIHTIVLLVANVVGTVTVSVQGDTTGYFYLGAVNTTADSLFRVAVASQFDPTNTVKIVAASGGSATLYIGAASDVESLNISNTVTTTGNVTVTNTVQITGSVTASFPSAQQVNIENVPTINIDPSGNGVVINSGTVDATISNATLDVSVQNSSLSVNVANTPTIEISTSGNGVTVNSGSINATIQNASLNSKVINEYLSTNELVFLGANSITTGGTAPTSISVPVSTPNAAANVFDAIYLIAETNARVLVGFMDTSTVQLSLKGTNGFVYDFFIGVGASIFTGDTLEQEYPALFDFLTFTLNSNSLLANTQYNFTVYGGRLTRPVVTVNNQASLRDLSGTITTANTWQSLGNAFSASYYVLFQNQGSGNMQLNWSDSVNAPSTPGILLTPFGSFVSDSTNIASEVLTKNVFWVKGANAGDAFTFLFI